MIRGFVGTLIYILIFPLLWLFLRVNSRTRAVIRLEEKVLLVKPWLGTGRWDLPGGGLHYNEKPRQGVAREVFEETGIEIAAREFSPLGSFRQGGWFKSKVYCFKVDLKVRPKVKKQYVEIIDIKWVDTADISAYRLSDQAKNALDLWKSYS